MSTVTPPGSQLLDGVSQQERGGAGSSLAHLAEGMLSNAGQFFDQSWAICSDDAAFSGVDELAVAERPDGQVGAAAGVRPSGMPRLPGCSLR